MFVRLLKGPQPANILLIILFSTLLWLKVFYVHDHSGQEYFVPYLQTVMQEFANVQWINSITLFVIILFQAFYMVRINLEYIFIDKRTYFPAIVYILWITLMIGSSHFNAAIIANIFILFAIENILKIKIGRLNIKYVFKAGLLIGCSTLFYWPAALMVLPIWIITFILHGINWRGLIAQLIGVLSPWMFVFFGYFITEQHGIYAQLLEKLFSERTITFGNNIESYRLYFIAFIVIVSFLYHFGHITMKKIIIRKYFSGMMWFAIIITAAIVAIPSDGIAGLIMAGIPATLFLSNQFLTTKSNFLTEAVFAIYATTAIIWVVQL